MNQREFLKTLKDNASKFDWSIEPHFGMLRAISKRSTCKDTMCPIEAVGVVRKLTTPKRAYFSTVAEKLAMPARTMERIVSCADSRDPKPLRKQMLKAVGIKEKVL